jgi:hypothetical protein
MSAPSVADGTLGKTDMPARRGRKERQVSETPTEYRFEMTDEQRERAAMSNLTTDMSTYELGEWILRLQRERDAAIARAEAVERVVEAALRDQRVNRKHVALCRQLDVNEWSPELIAVQDEMIAAAVDLDIALDDLSATRQEATNAE